MDENDCSLSLFLSFNLIGLQDQLRGDGEKNPVFCFVFSTVFLQIVSEVSGKGRGERGDSSLPLRADSSSAQAVEFLRNSGPRSPT